MFRDLFEDLRFVIGLLFTLLGTILVFLGVFYPETKPAGVNLNLTSGICMGIFGLFMLTLGIRTYRNTPKPEK